TLPPASGSTGVKVAQAPRYSAGDMVRHPRFGEGTVTQVRMQGGDEEVEVRFAAGVTKRLLAALAKMEKIAG
ncbi:MAG: hypothetical protein M3P51_06445, partial [Chloroflexota bacterium]|nr:hypothetical protein [Chloroflexota bacterium]